MEELRRIGARTCLLGGLSWGLAGGLAGCLQVPKPCPEVVWAAAEEGRVTPQVAFEAFRTAVRGDVLAAEYDSFSPDWKAATGLGQAEYRLMRDDLLERGPFRYALHKASVEWIPDPRPDHARVLARYWGVTMDFRLRRYAYVEARADASVGVRGELEDRHLGRIGERLQWVEANGRWYVSGSAVYRERVPDDRMQAVTVGHEWLIDDLVVHDGEPPDLAAPPGAP